MAINNDGMRTKFEEIGGKLLEVDRGIRAHYTGQPADEIEPVAVERFTAAGLNFIGSMRDYAETVERNEPLEIKLQ